ncbi:hypothetical protein AWC11_23180 [Mycobacterium interjectum]|nr:hypothetical protein AWC11_23180 [Mycobacterium interjectum]
MSQENDTRLPGAHVHTSADIHLPTVRPIDNFPGKYALNFGWDFSIHLTAEQWDKIDAAVRAGIAAARLAVAS